MHSSSTDALGEGMNPLIPVFCPMVKPSDYFSVKLEIRIKR